MIVSLASKSKGRILIADGLHVIAALKKAFARSKEEKDTGVSVDYDPRLQEAPRICSEREKNVQAAERQRERERERRETYRE